MTAVDDAERVARLREAVRIGLLHLPDAIHDDESWGQAWEELSNDAQEEVKACRRTMEAALDLRGAAT